MHGIPRFGRGFVALGLALAACFHEAEARYLVARTSEDVVAIDLTTGAVVSHYGVPLEIPMSFQTVEWDGTGYLLANATAQQVWRVDHRFHAPVFLFDLPETTPKDMALLGGDLFVIGQSAIGADSVFVLDPVSGSRERAFAVPDSIGLQAGLESDGTHLWAVDVAAARLWRCDPASGSFEFSHPLPNQLTFAVAWDPELSELWIIDNLARAASTLSRETGAMTPRFTLDDGVSFVWAAITTSTVTPTVRTSWGALKEHFSPAGREEFSP